MVIKFTDEMKKLVSVAELPIVATLTAEFTNSEENEIGYAEMAARAILKTNDVCVLRASAEIAKNCRVLDRMFDGSSDFDVWIDFIAIGESSETEIVIGGAYLSDIWDLCGDREIDDNLVNHMYSRKFKEYK